MIDPDEALRRTLDLAARPTSEFVTLDDALGRAAGILLGVPGTSDAIDAAVVLLSRDRDEVLTSDPHDLAILAEAAGLQIDLVPV